MRSSFLCALLLWICASAFSRASSAAESGDPSDAFVDAWMLVQQAEKTEHAGNLKPALEKFREAVGMFDNISRDYPSWSPAIVKYRKERTAEAIAQLEEKLGFYGPPAPLPKAPPEASSGRAHEDAGEPSDAFVDAWMLAQEAEKAEVAGDFERALAKFQEAARKLEKISKEHPAWNPNILRYREKCTARAIERLQWELKHPHSPVPAPLQDPKFENFLPDQPKPVPFPEPKDLTNGITPILNRER